MFSDAQLRFLADVCVALGQISFASLVIPYFVSGLGASFLASGTVLGLGFLIVGLFLAKRIK
ncbi:MAG: hypothetical protein HY001_01235 [Candidatus Portnoybacteria bacterium]|nr:hypothetical protein [Candidatus Portnoybacteria bacterium]